MLTAAVLVVIAIGASLVSGLPKPTQYLVGGARFSIDFPTRLRPHTTLLSSQFPPCTAGDAGSADRGRLAVSVVVFEEGGDCLALSSSSATTVSYSCTSYPPAGTGRASVTVRHVPGGEYCLANADVMRRGYFIMVMVESNEGPAAAESVVKSFTVLGS